jgi:CheY-like chemotaxis protein
MSDKVIVFDGLLRQLPGLFVKLEEAGAECVLVDGGKSALAKAREIAPPVVLLDIVMPQMSGVEVCRQLKEGGAGSKVILVSEQSSETLQARALDAGCDLFAARAEAEVQIGGFLRQHVHKAPPGSGAAAPQATNKRQYPRYEVSGAVNYMIGGKESRGELLNASASGVLFAAESSVPAGTEVLLEFENLDGSTFSLMTRAVRSVTLKQVRGKLAYGVGVKFENVEPEDREKLDALFAFKERSSMRLDPEKVRKVVTMPLPMMALALTGAEDPGGVRTFAGELAPHEATAFEFKGQPHDCIRKLVALRVQTAAAYAFVPTLEADRKILLPVFAPLFRELLRAIDAAEGEIDPVVRECVNTGNDDARRQVVESANRLHETKVKFLLAMDVIPTEGLAAAEKEVLAEIRERANAFRPEAKPAGPAPKFERRAPPPQRAWEEEESEEKRRGLPKAAQISIIAVAALVLAGTFFLRGGKRVASGDLLIPLPTNRIVVEEEILQIHLTAAAWTRASEKDRQDSFQKVIEYLKAKRIVQADFFDEKGRRLAAISSAATGRTRTYLPRILVTP